MKTLTLTLAALLLVSCTNPVEHLSKDTYALACNPFEPRLAVDEYRVSEEYQNDIEMDKLVYILPNDDLQDNDLQVEFSDGQVPSDAENCVF